MTTRTTQAQVEGFVKSINMRLKKRGSKNFITIGYSYGRTQLELVTEEQLHNVGKGIQRDLISGTKQECWDYLHAISDTMYYFSGE
jgi:hypothetical protein